MRTPLSPKVFRVTVAPYVHEDAGREAELRARKVLEARGKAARQLGRDPTHVICAPDLKINLDVLEGEGLTVVRRRSRERALEKMVDLAVPLYEEALLQGRLL